MLCMLMTIFVRLLYKYMNFVLLLITLFQYM